MFFLFFFLLSYVFWWVCSEKVGPVGTLKTALRVALAGLRGYIIELSMLRFRLFRRFMILTGAVWQIRLMLVSFLPAAIRLKCLLQRVEPGGSGVRPGSSASEGTWSSMLDLSLKGWLPRLPHPQIDSRHRNRLGRQEAALVLSISSTTAFEQALFLPFPYVRRGRSLQMLRSLGGEGGRGGFGRDFRSAVHAPIQFCKFCRPPRM